jgi:FtsH-binding integral membrane protein
MQALHLTESRKSLYFWPGATLLATALFFFVWGVLISGQNWLGQAIWGTLAAVFALVFLAMAVRESHRTLRSALGRIVPPTGLGDRIS